MTYYCGVGPINYDWIAPGIYVDRGVPASYITGLSTQVMSSDAMIQKNGGNVRGEIEAKRGYCNQAASQNKTKANNACAAQDNIGWTVGMDAGYMVVFGNFSVTIEKPNYDKCVNNVNSLSEEAKDNCQDTYIKDMSRARNAMPATCVSVFNF
ncbi:MAG TPA: hypothetical protein VL995_00830 [Cellvibrio sp.]|nr:hypothetical protein [Cellvibrio sp.]